MLYMHTPSPTTPSSIPPSPMPRYSSPPSPTTPYNTPRRTPHRHLHPPHHKQRTPTSCFFPPTVHLQGCGSFHRPHRPPPRVRSRFLPPSTSKGAVTLPTFKPAPARVCSFAHGHTDHGQTQMSHGHSSSRLILQQQSCSIDYEQPCS